MVSSTLPPPSVIVLWKLALLKPDKFAPVPRATAARVQTLISSGTLDSREQSPADTSGGIKINLGTKRKAVDDPDGSPNPKR